MKLQSRIFSGSLLALSSLLCAAVPAVAQTTLFEWNFNDAVTGPGGVPGSTPAGTIRGTGTVGAPGSGVSGQSGDRAFNNTESTMGYLGGNVFYSGNGFGLQESFTVVMWFKTDGGSLSAGTRLLQFNSNTGTGAQGLLFAVGAGGILNINDHANNTRLAQVDMAGTPLELDGEWVFLAVTYDGTKAADSTTTVYAGSASQTVVELSNVSGGTTSSRTGAWQFSNSNIGMSFGGYTTGGDNDFSVDGYMDNIRLIGGSGGSGALDAAALNQIRLNDLQNIPEPSAAYGLALAAAGAVYLMRRRKKVAR